MAPTEPAISKANTNSAAGGGLDLFDSTGAARVERIRCTELAGEPRAYRRRGRLQRRDARRQPDPSKRAQPDAAETDHRHA